LVLREGINMNGAKRICAVVARRCQDWLPWQTRRSAGNIALTMAVLLTSLMGLAGAGVDYGMIVIETARLQNALDAASLAGARALVTSTLANQSDRDSAAEDVAKQYLGYQLYPTDGSNGVTFTFVKSSSDTTTGASHDTMQVNGTVVKPTSFWKVIGINSTTINRTSTAVASGAMVDVMLSLDTSGSMERSGTDDLGQLRDAVVDFINQMQVDPANTRGTQVGIARFAGIKCRWDRGTTSSGSTHGNGDTYIDQDRGPHGSEYITPCDDDVNVMIGLTMNKDALLKVARNDGTTTCPAGAVGMGCPISSPKYRSVPITYGTPTVGGTPIPASGLRDNYSDGNSSNNRQWLAWTGTPADCDSGSAWCMATGTKISAGMSGVTSMWNAPSGSWNASYTGTGSNGRTDAATTGVARKILVLMTDGVNESSQIGIPSNYTPVLDDWDTTTRTAATNLKAAGVEIYVVGFYCSDGNSPNGWCSSKLVYTDMDSRPCIGGRAWPSSTSATSDVDKLLRDVSSSSSGTCDHYFPVRKTEDLPQLFRVVAGSIARGKLQ
jgi:Flp pilus assembly protein TadG